MTRKSIVFGRLSIACLAAVMASATLAEDIYRNDFSTRTSAATLPGDRWMSYDYDPERTLYRNYGNGNPLPLNFWNFPDQIQDGWMKAYMDSATMADPPGFAVATDPVHGSSDNYFALFRSSTARSGCAVHPFHNEFTNGTIRFEIDIRRPSVWGNTEEATHAVRALLVYRKYMDPVWNTKLASTKFPCLFGAYWDGKDKNRLEFQYYSREEGQTKTLYPGKNGDNYECNDHWYRWRVYVNLDEQRVNCYVWDAGESQPDGRNAQADGTATRIVANTIYFFRDEMNEETGGIVGIGLNGYRFKAGTGASLAVTNAPCYDNIYLAWKAPGTSEYVPFYENDFNTRRFRRIQPTPATTVAYPRDVAVSPVDIFSSYAAMASNVTELAAPTYLVSNSALGDPGMDNWVRLVAGNRVSVVDSKTAGGNMMCAFTPVSADGGNGVVAQTLGETITSGKVRISSDVRLPGEWRVTAETDARVCLALGSDTYWSGDPSTYTARHIGYGAIVGESANEFRPAYLPASGGLVTTKSADVTCTPTNWYRMVVTADLDARKYDYELYALGLNAGRYDRADVPAEPVYATNSIPFRNSKSNVPNIGAFSLFTYRAGTNWNSYVLWDNIQVWKNWDSTSGTGTLIYLNDFNDRKRYVEREKTELVHGAYTGVGVDAWEHVNRGEGTAWIMGDSNRFLTIKAPDNYSLYLTQPLSDEVPNGRRVTFRADVRPPCWWLNVGGQLLNIYLGGDKMCQYSDARDARPLDDSVMAFGLSHEASSLGRYTNTVLRVQDGSGANPVAGVPPLKTDHWYRLEGTTISGSGTWKFRAYDMGTAHPEIDTPPPGEPLATVDGLARRSSGATSGISSILIAAGGVAGLEPWNLYDRGRVLVDNIVVTALPSGACFIIR